MIEIEHPEDAPHIEKAFTDAKEHGKIYDIEHRIIRVDNKEIRYIKASGEVEYDQDTGSPVRMVGADQDITERKQAEIALKESEQFLKILLESMPLPVFYKDVEGRYKGFNKAFETFFDRPKSELIGCSVFDINPPELARIYHAKDSELFKKISTQIYESEVKNAYGELRDVVFHKATLTNTSGAITGLVGAIMDITESKQAEKALIESEAMFRGMFKDHSAVMLLIDPHTGQIVEVNQAAAQYYGYPMENMIQMKIQQLNLLSPAEIMEKIGGAFNKQVNIFEFRHLLADGLVRDVEVHSAPITIQHQTLLFSIIHDITERKRVEEERNQLVIDLQRALANVKQLTGLLPICSHCKKIRDDKGYWNQIESYIHEHSEVKFSHSICQDCAKKHYPDFDIYED
ncbi:MAG: PAS domain S-box protein [Desulfamplus sp.]|nr:PAS domain S-box protein [Desulfamplus sp.]